MLRHEIKKRILMFYREKKVTFTVYSLTFQNGRVDRSNVSIQALVTLLLFLFSNCAVIFCRDSFALHVYNNCVQGVKRNI